jgi:hypothetical protein
MTRQQRRIRKLASINSNRFVKLPTFITLDKLLYYNLFNFAIRRWLYFMVVFFFKKKRAQVVGLRAHV